jgi:Ca2+-binding EF-hand superfamily protein
MRITNHEEIRQMFLRYDKDRNGYITRENIFDLFRPINLPLENDLVDAVRERRNKNFKFIYLIFVLFFIFR